MPQEREIIRVFATTINYLGKTASQCMVECRLDQSTDKLTLQCDRLHIKEKDAFKLRAFKIDENPNGTVTIRTDGLSLTAERESLSPILRSIERAKGVSSSAAAAKTRTESSSSSANSNNNSSNNSSAGGRSHSHYFANKSALSFVSSPVKKIASEASPFPRDSLGHWNDNSNSPPYAPLENSPSASSSSSKRDTTRQIAGLFGPPRERAREPASSSANRDAEKPGELVFEKKNVQKTYGKHTISSRPQLLAAAAPSLKKRLFEGEEWDEQSTAESVFSTSTPPDKSSHHKVKAVRVDEYHPTFAFTAPPSVRGEKEKEKKSGDNPWGSFMKRSQEEQKKRVALITAERDEGKDEGDWRDSPINTPLWPSAQTNKLSFDRISDNAPLSLSMSSFAAKPKTEFMGGARNLGNSCYMSAVVQALSVLYDFSTDMLSPFWTSLIQHQLAEEAAQREREREKEREREEEQSAEEKKEPESEHRLVRMPLRSTRATTDKDDTLSICDIFQQVLRLKEDMRGKPSKPKTSFFSAIPTNLFDDVLDLRSLKKAMGRNAIYAGMGQQDAHEFLNDLLNGLETEMHARFKRWLAEQCSPVITEDERVEDDVVNKDMSLFSSPESITAMPFSAVKPSRAMKSSSFSEQSLPSFSMTTAQSESLHALCPPAFHFESVMQMDLQCLQCGFTHEPRFEKYRDLSLSLHEEELDSDSDPSLLSPSLPLDLENLLSLFLKDETRELRCPHCTEGNSVRIHKRFVTLSPLLILHLKRFRYDPKSESLKKIAHPVCIPVQLDLRKSTLLTTSSDENTLLAKSRNNVRESVHTLWQKRCDTGDTEEKINEIEARESETMKLQILREMEALHSLFPSIPSSFTPSSPSLVSEVSEEEKKDASAEDDMKQCYQLCGVVRHLGSTLHSGHYICDIRERQRKTNAEEEKQGENLHWLRYNDDRVNSISETEVLGEMNNSYILFFQR